ncbi:MAG TPA: pitrilysin family protein [Patescibacteria group bacterium]|nr:pitrilysin family protein [Patescibacteria group bacterium]
MYTKHVLKNGLRVILMPMEGTETITTLVAINAGSRFEMPQEAGIAHFLEHMAFKGTKKRPTALDISKELDSVGAEYNAFTSKEMIAFYAKVGKQYASMSLDIIADMLTNAKLPGAEIEREKGVIIEEMRLYQDTPMRYVDDIFEELMYGKTPMGKMIIGTEQTIRSFSRKMFLNYQAGLYRSSNMVVCVAGKMDHKKMLTVVKRFFGKITNGPVRSKTSTPLTQEKPQLFIHWKKTDQTHLMIGFRGYHLGHPRRMAAELLATILGGGTSSRLFHSVRERRGLAYYVRAGSQSYTDVGYLSAQAGVTNKKVEQAIKQILFEFRKLKTVPVSTAELRKAKDYVKGHIQLSLESSDEVASWGAMQEILEKKIQTVKEIFRRIDRISARDIRLVAKELFVNDRLNLAMIGPFRETKPFEKLLKV